MYELLNNQEITKQIVLFRLSALGDVCLCTGLINYLNRLYHYKFIVITKKSFSPIFENNPAVSQIIALENDDLKLSSYIKISYKLAQKYKNSILLDLHSNTRSKILSFFWKNKVFSYPKYKLKRWLFLHFKNRQAQAELLATNVLERYSLAIFPTKIARTELKTKIYITQDEKNFAQTSIKKIYPNSAKLVILHPYASYPTKNWLEENWQSLIELLQKSQINFLIVGQNKVDRQTLVKNILPKTEQNSTVPAYDLTNKNTLRQTMAFIEAAQVFVSSDSGPMHLATALETKLVAIFGPTSEEWGFYPSSKKQKIFEANLACRPCSLHGSKPCKRGLACHKATTVEEVFEEILNSLA